MDKVLVTGATGFIGNHVVRELLKRDIPVVASSATVAKAQRADWFSKVSYIPFDISQINADINYFELFQQPDRLIHLAWEGLPNYKSAFHLEQNLPRHKVFLENLIVHGLNDLTVIGTCLEYGMQQGSLSENLPAMPSNPYAIAKNELRKFLQSLQETRPVTLKWVRLFYMYGQGQNPNSLLSQLDNALLRNEKVFNMTGGEQTRDYLPVEKVAEYIVTIALQNRITGVINCSSGEPVTIKELVKEYLSGRKNQISLNTGYYPYPDYEPMHFWGDNSRLKTILDERRDTGVY